MVNIAQSFQPIAPDKAMEEFRKIFPSNNCIIFNGGRSMSYKLPHLHAAFNNLTRAHQIIKQQELPLCARVYCDYSNFILNISLTA